MYKPSSKTLVPIIRDSNIDFIKLSRKEQVLLSLQSLKKELHNMSCTAQNINISNNSKQNLD